ncbi:hypothetical protein Ancab_000638 [Ancistrocladus abbreviatus]
MADHRPQEGNPCLHTNVNTGRNNGVSRIPAIASAMHDYQPPQRPHYSLIDVNFGELLIVILAHSTLDHTGQDCVTNTVPVHQSVNDPHYMIPHKNDLEHPVENGGSDCETIVGLGMEVGGRSQNGDMLPIENLMDTEFLSYMEPDAYYPSAQFGVGSSDQSRGVDGENLSGKQPI